MSEAENDGRWQMYEESYFYFRCFASRWWNMMKIKCPEERWEELKLFSDLKQHFEIYCWVKFHQMVINQKLNLLDDTIFIVSRAAEEKQHQRRNII